MTGPVRQVLVVVAAGTVLAMGCGDDGGSSTATTEPATTEQTTEDAATGQLTASEALMVDAVRDEADDGASEFTDSQIVEYGETVCDAADENELEGFFFDLLAELRAEGITEPEGDAKFVAVAAAVFALCPEHNGQWEQVIANVEQLYPE